MTIKEIAAMLGISTTTVSNVIHGKTKEVSPKTIERVQAVLKEYNYVPNISARNLAQNESKIIGVAMRTREEKYDNALKDPFTGELIGGIEKALRKSDYFMMLYISEDVEEIAQHISLWNADGLLLLGILGEDWRKIRDNYKKPTVFIDSYFDPELKEVVNVGLQDFQGAYDMTKYLISCGHKNIAFLSDNKWGVDLERFNGFAKAMKDANLPFDEEQNFLYHRPEKSRRAKSFEEICQKSREFTAIFCASDIYAASLIKEFRKRKICVPEEISVVGFDDNDLSKYAYPSITTVHQNPEEKGTIAVDCLIQMIHKKSLKENRILLPTELVYRESVKTLK